MTRRQRVEAEPAYVLHARPWRETSLLLEVLTLEHGRLALAAKGARRPGSQLRPVLLTFQPLVLGWRGAGEVRTLTRAEWAGGVPLPRGRALWCGYYLNELVLRLLAREDPHREVFLAYDTAVRALARGEALSPVLRRFELAFLAALGYGLDWPQAAAGRYRFEPRAGLVLLAEGETARSGEAILSAETLEDVRAGRWSRPETLAEVRALTRRLIDHALDGQELQARRMLRELLE
ncbi:DNA repair protein RecO [Tepidiphilus thermophilus]|jgi:DNA repair protein RecO (recombination protein O)|uniref:DNA repair protein RecO n=1 Tax=Tepidiphilus thermophilus TaxID=876478 RepID=A0A0K6IXV0_9PROT|nr:DNA repair protein RecO [Tepidiphilus thermophilus]CUB07928.1 DNA replication and repair protein RecO [Tepidiphilus thermophilus]